MKVLYKCRVCGSIKEGPEYLLDRGSMAPAWIVHLHVAAEKKWLPDSLHKIAQGKELNEELLVQECGDHVGFFDVVGFRK